MDDDELQEFFCWLSCLGTLEEWWDDEGFSSETFDDFAREQNMYKAEREMRSTLQALGGRVTMIDFHPNWASRCAIRHCFAQVATLHPPTPLPLHAVGIVKLQDLPLQNLSCLLAHNGALRSMPALKSLDIGLLRDKVDDQLEGEPDSCWSCFDYDVWAEKLQAVLHSGVLLKVHEVSLLCQCGRRFFELPGVSEILQTTHKLEGVQRLELGRDNVNEDFLQSTARVMPHISELQVYLDLAGLAHFLASGPFLCFSSLSKLTICVDALWGMGATIGRRKLLVLGQGHLSELLHEGYAILASSADPTSILNARPVSFIVQLEVPSVCGGMSTESVRALKKVAKDWRARSVALFGAVSTRLRLRMRTVKHGQ